MTHIPSDNTMAFMDGAMCAFFWEALRQRGYFTEEQISQGLLPQLFTGVSMLPTPPPLNPDVPQFAVVLVENHPHLAYWDFLAQTGWILTEPPWDTPILFPEYLIDTDNTLGAGAATWRYAMGPEFQVLRVCEISALSYKFGGPGDHAWAIRRSTAAGDSAPALSSYTDVLASGVVSVPTANVWTEHVLSSPVSCEPGEWIVVQCFPGLNAGQNFQIASARAQNLINEAFARLEAGTYVYRGGNNPGTTAPPSARIASTCYGLVSPKFGGATS